MADGECASAWLWLSLPHSIGSVPLARPGTKRETIVRTGCTKKFEYNDVRLGQYKTYLNFIEAIANRFHFGVVLEALRIPSTKNLCFVSRASEQQTGQPEHP